MTLLFFDLETTGKSTTKDKIVQLSAIKTDEHFNILEKKKIFINPEMDIPIEATNVHGITNEMVKPYGTFKHYSEPILKFFDVDVLIGYNIIHYDIPLLAEEFGRCGLEWPKTDIKIIDSFSIFQKNEPRNLTAALKFYTGKNMEGAHDAENDNLAVIEILQGQMFLYGMELNNCLHVSDSNKVDFAGKIILKDGVPCFSFGKWQDQPVKEHLDYATWMLGGDFSCNTKNVLRSIIGNDIKNER